MNWSTYQQVIFDWAKIRNTHLMVEACAGSGKTTTIVQLYKELQVNDTGCSILFQAFNKKIADELASRGVPASTMNAFGFRALKMSHPRIKLDEYKVNNICKFFNVERNKQGIVKRAVDLMKAMVAPLNSDAQYVRNLCYDYGLVEDKVPENLFEVIGNVFRQSLNDMNVIDFSDQIAYPVYHNMNIPKFDYVIVDEAQDLSPVKLELVSRAVGERFICVGDSYQAIYGFAGADSESMNKIRDKFNPTVLTLPVTYRCGKSIVKQAQPYAPKDFQAGESNPEGKVNNVKHDEFEKNVKPLDFVLCRTTAPLVSSAFGLIAKGTRCTVLGRDIGKKLVDLVDRIRDYKTGECRTQGGSAQTEMGLWCSAYNIYKVKELDKLYQAEKESQAQTLEDQLNCLWVFVENCQTIEEMKGKIASLFDDNVNPNSVIFSTIHKSKGLESERVWILPSKAMKCKTEKQSKEESNLLYVAYTRSKSELNLIK